MNDIVSVQSLQNDNRQLSERLAALEAMTRQRDNDDRFRYFFEHSPVGKSITEISGRSKVNQAICNLLGYSPEELQNINWLQSTHPDDVELTQREVDALVAEKKASARFIKRFLHRNGKVVWVDLSTALRRNSAGEPLHFVTTMTDVSERMRIEDALRQSKESIEAAASAGIIGFWDWQVPSNILTYDETMYRLYGIRSEDFGGAYEAWASAIHPDDRAHAEAEVQAALRGEREYCTEFRVIWPDGSVRYIKGVGRTTFDVQGKPLRMVGVNYDLTEQKSTEQTLRREVDKNRTLLRNAGDATRMQQALLNYANNAVKFTESGTITSRVRIAEETARSALVRFEVQDSGIGIAAEAIDKLFMPLEQVDNSSTRKFGGTGLGLAITSKLAQLMGGNAGVMSTAGQGITFWFTARLTKGASETVSVVAAAAVGSAEAALQRNYPGRHVLLVEDEPTILEITVELLGSVGQRVSCARVGLLAVDLVERNRYDMILMDMQMPNLNGIEATRRIRLMANGAQAPILAMTANSYREDMVQCLEAGMNDFISKPVDPERLFATLLKWLGDDQS